MSPRPCTRSHHDHQAATAASYDIRAGDGDTVGVGTLADGADATVVIAGACAAPDPASRTGDGLTGAGDDEGDAGVRVG